METVLTSQSLLRSFIWGCMYRRRCYWMSRRVASGAAWCTRVCSPVTIVALHRSSLTWGHHWSSARVKSHDARDCHLAGSSSSRSSHWQPNVDTPAQDITPLPISQTITNEQISSGQTHVYFLSFIPCMTFWKVITIARMLSINKDATQHS